MKKVLVSIMSLLLCFSIFGFTPASAAGYTHFDYEEDGVRAGRTLEFPKEMTLSGTVEIVAVQHSPKTKDVNIKYTLVNVDTGKTVSETIDGTYDGKSKTIKFTNVKEGTYTIKIKNNSEEKVYGNFYVYD
ncbi:DUF3244 domain-containing protein [Bacillus sp. TH22]|uniref:DUF3244 domain-containing protein n=1 Tax=unclassified Bacillus (in: firmicutes) TaxID=185979 RepID=UPI0019119AA4|nr:MULTISPECIES: DUF3244 domain-containing protein [unclassified Bacillus (in: firmicutes)]MBK5358732.1 DUF3244 domain-containing protein [Bacillus sp. TH44]MBK5345785.1 DUF3244 domain-containing protein [Bacillus sp. TH45]MBK5367497.1 DUF3244 domain-containing protein [Bacillus sp. TH50]MBK5452442.1 DUF3244 domain-containing protein [Bacillus sp. TH22]MBK5457952.1 DUF3244 domain-containing protein [Bacillus sp. TH23]